MPPLNRPMMQVLTSVLAVALLLLVPSCSNASEMDPHASVTPTSLALGGHAGRIAKLVPDCVDNSQFFLVTMPLLRCAPAVPFEPSLHELQRLKGIGRIRGPYLEVAPSR